MDNQYESPSIVELGTLTELTLQQNKDFGGNDGNSFQGTPITNAS